MVRSELGDLKQDFVFGTAAASIAGLAIWVFVLGQKTQAEAGWAALQVAIAGLAVAECLKRGLTGKHLSLGEALQDLLVSGGLAATARLKANTTATRAANSDTSVSAAQPAGSEPVATIRSRSPDSNNSRLPTA